MKFGATPTFMTMDKTIQNFRVLPLRFSTSSTSSHDIFFKENSLKAYDETKPIGKTLFVTNIPPYADEKSLKTVFTKAGKVRKVEIKSIHRPGKNQNCGFKNAYVIYDKREGLLRALKMNQLEPLSSEKQPVDIGLSKWVKEYNKSIVDHEQLQQEAEKYIEEYDRMEAEKASKQKEVDDEGWTVVTKKGRNPGVARKESVSKKLAQKMKLKSQKKALKNFYASQIRESKIKAVEELRKKYEQDKHKVEAMKKMRKFKPY